MGGKRMEPGQVYGRLTLLRLEHMLTGTGAVRAYWRCRCECGNEVLTQSGTLRSTSKCPDCAPVEGRGWHRVTHGYTRGGKPSPVYTAWQSMWSRCRDPKNKRYADYGGRGITVDERWRTFEGFIDSMGAPPEPDMQLEREDNDKGYSPENCVWATRSQQGRNKRNNVKLTYQGRTQLMIEWCEELGLRYDTVKRRAQKGWTAEEALAPGDLRRVEPSRTTVA